ncbi:MAG: M23 family metallopeptidase, partial [Actinobacteria bacterium]|nr:M23 family metallopeptidase [Actinomycetota bacterium]
FIPRTIERPPPAPACCAGPGLRTGTARNSIVLAALGLWLLASTDSTPARGAGPGSPINWGEQVPHARITRRGLLGLGAAAAAAVALPVTGAATVSLIDPYSGAIPLVCPLAEGTYSTTVASSWHAGREGRAYPWSHVNGAALRAHDGVDTYPAPGVLPAVYAPLTGIVAAICLRTANTPDAPVAYAVSDTTPPPWDLSQAVDDIANLPLYGNFIWLYSTDGSSNGYFVFFCHLQNEPVIHSLVPDQPVGVQSQLGVVGDSGNAAGAPQLHTEIHYPPGFSYPCRHCAPGRALTSLNPEASLLRAARRSLAAT